MSKPEVIALDYETTGLEFYRPDFRVLSAAFAWFSEDGIKTRYLEGEDAVRRMLVKIAKDGIPLVVHNAQFELGVTRCRFPGVSVNIAYDTMRLGQVADNGGKEAQAWEEKTLDDELAELEGEAQRNRTGLRLQQIVSRWLPRECHNHKEPYYEWLREHGVKAGKEGENLHLLPPDQFEAYNVADAELTLRLYERFTSHFRDIKYAWQLDHQLYMASVGRIVEAKIRGVRVDVQKLVEYRDEVAREIEAIGEAFRTHFKEDVAALEREYVERYVAKRKSERGQRAARAHASDDPTVCAFNVGSTHHLADLFVRRLGVSPKFTTEKGTPSFKAALLGQWGEGGLMLKKRRSRLVVLKQVEALLALAEHDGRWHVDLKACGTTTGRYAGGRND